LRLLPNEWAAVAAVAKERGSGVSEVLRKALVDAGILQSSIQAGHADRPAVATAAQESVAGVPAAAERAPAGARLPFDEDELDRATTAGVRRARRRAAVQAGQLANTLYRYNLRLLDPQTTDDDAVGLIDVVESLRYLAVPKREEAIFYLRYFVRDASERLRAGESRSEVRAPRKLERNLKVVQDHPERFLEGDLDEHFQALFDEAWMAWDSWEQLCPEPANRVHWTMLVKPIAASGQGTTKTSTGRLQPELRALAEVVKEAGLVPQDATDTAIERRLKRVWADTPVRPPKYPRN